MKETVYDKKIGNTVYTVVLRPSETAKNSIFDLTKKMIESGVEDMLSATNLQSVLIRSNL